MSPVPTVMGGDVEPFVSKAVAKALKAKANGLSKVRKT